MIFGIALKERNGGRTYRAALSVVTGTTIKLEDYTRGLEPAVTSYRYNGNVNVERRSSSHVKLI